MSALGPLGTLVSDELEREYREDQRLHNVRVARVATAFGVLANVPLGIVDIASQSDPRQLKVLLAARAVNAVAAALIFTRLPALASARDRDRLVLLWAALFALTSIPLVLNRPASLGPPLGAGLLLVVVFALVMPAGFRHQLCAIGFLLVAFLGARAWHGFPTSSAQALAILAVGIALTLFASLRLHRSRRELFLSLHEQRALRAELEGALAEIRTLRGIVPIPLVLPQNPGRRGDWHRVETYVSKHTHAKSRMRSAPRARRRTTRRTISRSEPGRSRSARAARPSRRRSSRAHGRPAFALVAVGARLADLRRAHLDERVAATPRPPPRRPSTAAMRSPPPWPRKNAAPAAHGAASA